MNNLKCQFGKRIHAKDRELCATCWRKTPEGKADGNRRQREYQQRVKEHFARGTAVAICVLSACTAVHADPLPPGGKAQRVFPGEERGPSPRISAGDPLGYRPAVFPRIPGGASSERLFDLPVTGGGRYGQQPWAPGRGSLVGWNPPGLDRPPGGGGGHGDWKPPHPEPPSPPNQDDVPGPLPIAGAAAAWGWARRLRRRVR